MRDLRRGLFRDRIRPALAGGIVPLQRGDAVASTATIGVQTFFDDGGPLLQRASRGKQWAELLRIKL